MKYQVYVSLWYDVPKLAIIDSIKRGNPKEFQTSRCVIVEAETEPEAIKKAVFWIHDCKTADGDPMFTAGSYDIQAVEKYEEKPNPYFAMFGIEE